MNDLIRRNDPFDVLQRFGDFFERDPFLATSRQEWMPPVDIQESDNAYTFRMDVPGMKPDDLEVELHEGVLTIRGSRKEESKSEEKGYVRTERRQGSFSRQFRVPTTTSADNLTARVAEGVLTVDVPKGSGTEARRVPIS